MLKLYCLVVGWSSSSSSISVVEGSSGVRDRFRSDLGGLLVVELDVCSSSDELGA
jgi:hypothetical protein